MSIFGDLYKVCSDSGTPNLNSVHFKPTLAYMLKRETGRRGTGKRSSGLTKNKERKAEGGKPDLHQRLLVCRSPFAPRNETGGALVPSSDLFELLPFT